MNARDVLASVTGFCDACGAGPGVVCDPFCLGVAAEQDEHAGPNLLIRGEVHAKGKRLAACGENGRYPSAFTESTRSPVNCRICLHNARTAHLAPKGTR